MKKFGILIFIFALLAGVFFAGLFSFGKADSRIFSISIGDSVRGSGQTASEIRDLDEFTKVDVSGAFVVEIVAGGDFSVRVEADDNLVPLIRTEVRDGVLKISSSSHRLKSESPMKILVSSPSVDSVDTSGAANVSLAAARSQELRIESSGASNVQLTGETESLFVIVTGASKVDAASFKALSAKIGASGASRVDVLATEKLVADATGASEIQYSGDPKIVEKASSGASRINKK